MKISRERGELSARMRRLGIAEVKFRKEILGKRYDEYAEVMREFIYGKVSLRQINTFLATLTDHQRKELGRVREHAIRLIQEEELRSDLGLDKKQYELYLEMTLGIVRIPPDLEKMIMDENRENGLPGDRMNDLIARWIKAQPKS
jgi:flagellar biosynthesis component FlhA